MKRTRSTPGTANYRHGHKPADGYSPEYVSWNAMIARCHNENTPNYFRYGGRGITVCERWFNSFENFLADMGLRPSLRHSLERRDNDGHYCQANCYWGTDKEQANNRRSNRIIEYRGVSKTLAQWADDVGVKKNTLHARLSYYGWSVEKALTEPVR